MIANSHASANLAGIRKPAMLMIILGESAAGGLVKINKAEAKPRQSTVFLRRLEAEGVISLKGRVGEQYVV